jgi:hypothetical protein
MTGVVGFLSCHFKKISCRNMLNFAGYIGDKANNFKKIAHITQVVPGASRPALPQPGGPSGGFFDCGYRELRNIFTR